MAIKGKRLTSPRDYDEHPIWRFDRGADLHFPLLSTQEQIDSEHDLSVRVRFTTDSDAVLDGIIVGLGDILAVGFFVQDDILVINRNLPETAAAVVTELIEAGCVPLGTTVDSFFPLGFRTLIGRAPYTDISGKFEMPGPA